MLRLSLRLFHWKYLHETAHVELKLSDDSLQIVKRLDPRNIRLSIYTAVTPNEKYISIAEMQKRQLEKIPHTRWCRESAQMILINELDTIQGNQLDGLTTARLYGVDSQTAWGWWENCKWKIMKS